MKKHVVLVVAMMICTIIFAQEKKGSGKRVHGHTDKMKTELSLTDAQDASIKEINKRYGDQHALLRKDSATARTEKMEKSKRIREQREKDINAVLTPQQQTRWTALKREHADERKAHMKQASEDRQARMKKELSLSDEQASKVQNADKAFREKMMTLRKSNSGAKPDKDAVKNLVDEHESTMKAILTSDQFQKWKTMKSDQKKKHHDQHHRRG